MKTIVASKSDVKSVLAEIPKSAIISIVFQKKDGETRKLNGRRGVSYDRKTDRKGRKVSAENKEKYVCFYDVHKKDFRNVNIETTSKIIANKTTYIFL